MSHTHEDREFLQLHPHIVEQVQAELPSAEEQEGLVELFRMFADPTRLRILTVLQVSDMCVCHIAEVLGMTVSAISHQLRLLKQMHLVKFRREGKNILYSLADDHVRDIIEKALEHIKE